MQMSKFLGISGTGWLIDFLIYLLLTIKLNLDVGYSNFISGIPALTFVFLVSTRKIFEYKSDGHSLKMKYSIYFLYQMILIVIISLFGKVLYSIINVSSFYNIVIIKKYSKIITKLIITPITMVLNFCVMKILSEKY
ncbi:GtrA family protein [Clostridium beijerinckii]|uniref:Flippase GtrA n=2 Tax=Clostridium beijerinckii TaxID=1520 RepID=A0A9Q5CFX5_CLOBE|nr:GtrA family protein [Clostridium beijerinckii]AQS07062.1 GtrA-like protein [Clostridium beijerinckii]MBA2883558.1 putative flippase GtrA [Clostridium beijerinckii]MBA2898745.1 putative flippase GtrA [Clostridium beijerinckii]MBA2908145.1 putative flippase GtrA [Clostridium beijerinckii]MBA9013307.1 putative flippase GtrA [Clostridium beijerinckii]